LRLVLVGGVSTSGYLDQPSSRQWQYDNADRLITGQGVVVAEFFDTGYSRSLPWRQRPDAAALLAGASCPDRRFDAVVIGEYERAFAGRQALQVIPYLQAQGVAVWLPEFGGPVDLDDPTHRALFLLLGHQSEREVLRARRRTTRADAHAGARAGPASRRPAAVRLPPRRRRSASEPGPRAMGTPSAPFGSRSGHRVARAVDLRPPAGR
jgi:hypothetical protein